MIGVLSKNKLKLHCVTVRWSINITHSTIIKKKAHIFRCSFEEYSTYIVPLLLNNLNL